MSIFYWRKPLKCKDVLVTAARFALTDPRVGTVPCLCLSQCSLCRPLPSGYCWFLLPDSTDLDRATHPWSHKPSAHPSLLSATTCAKYLSFVIPHPLSTLSHPVCCPERWSGWSTAKAPMFYAYQSDLVNEKPWQVTGGREQREFVVFTCLVPSCEASSDLSLSTEVHCSS